MADKPARCHLHVVAARLLPMSVIFAYFRHQTCVVTLHSKIDLDILCIIFIS